MQKDTLTLALEGDVGLNEFSEAVRQFTALVHALSQEIGDESPIEWIIQELYSSSAVATVQGICETEGVVDRVVDAYATVGNALASGQDIPFSYGVARAATSLTGVLDGGITSIRFETADSDVIITGKPSAGYKSRPMKYAFGTVKGTVQTLMMRKSLKFMLYDHLFDKAISCYLKEGQEEEMRNAWGKRAAVFGRVGREPEYGRPVVVRDVNNIRIIRDVEPGSYKRAKGAIPWKEGDEPAEIIIRRLRDAQ